MTFIKKVRTFAQSARSRLWLSARSRSAKRRIAGLQDGDHMLPYQFQHRTLQPHLSADYLECEDAFGGEVALKWSRDGCGIASAIIAVEAARKPNGLKKALPPITEACELYRNTAYIPGIGWSHRGLVQFGLDHEVDTFNDPDETPDTVCFRMLEGWIPLASVTLYFRGGEPVAGEVGATKTRKPGGHLVVLVGFRVIGGQLLGFYVDDCQNTTLRDGDVSEEYVTIDAFQSSFSGKCIYFRPRNYRPLTI